MMLLVLSNSVFYSLVQTFKEILLLNLPLVDCEEVRLDTIEFVLDFTVLLKSLLTNCIVNNCSDCLREVVDVLTLFYLNMKKCTLQNISS